MSWPVIFQPTRGGCLICFTAGCFGLGGKTGPAALCQGLEATLATTSKDVPHKEPDTPRSPRAPLQANT